MNRAFEDEIRDDIAALIRSHDLQGSVAETDEAVPVTIAGHHNVTYVMPRGVIVIGSSNAEKSHPASYESLSGSTTS